MPPIGLNYKLRSVYQSRGDSNYTCIRYIRNHIRERDKVIDSQTTLVLGAGASMPFGLPSGKELRDLICEGTSPNSSISMILNQTMGFGLAEVEEFANTFWKSQLASIDAFLSIHERFNEIGKCGISALLCERENPYSVMNDNNDHWYHMLWNVLCEDAKSVGDLKQNKINFISFNYDRSLEYFLFESCKHTFGITDAVALDTVNHFNILHVYGKLGEFCYPGFPSNSARPYSLEIEPNLVKIGASGIKVIHELRDDGQAFEIGRNWFNTARKIGFLGFGFDKMNVRRLGLIDVLNHRRRHKSENELPRIVATVFGMTISEINHHHANVCDGFSWEPFDMKNTIALRESGLFR
jgi:hypothetical protein